MALAHRQQRFKLGVHVLNLSRSRSASLACITEALSQHSLLIGIPPSACLRKPMICSSVNLLFFVPALPL